MRTLQNSGDTIRKGNRSLCFQPWIYLHVLPRWQWYNPEPKIPARCSRRLDALKVSEQPIIKNICIKSCRNNINARGNTTKMLRRSRCWSLSLYVHIFSSFLLRLVCVISSFYFVSVSQVSYTGLTNEFVHKISRKHWCTQRWRFKPPSHGLSRFCEVVHNRCFTQVTFLLGLYCCLVFLGGPYWAPSCSCCIPPSFSRYRRVWFHCSLIRQRHASPRQYCSLGSHRRDW